MATNSPWPKQVPCLTPEQRRISDDFVKHWHEVLPARYGMIERFNHGYAVRHAPRTFTSTLEIGAGLGAHLAYERLSAEQERAYVSVDIRTNMIDELRRRYPAVQGLVADCQQRMPFPDGQFDRILAIHVLEHLPNLPDALAEMQRLCNPLVGCVSVVIPCEGGLAYTIARRISAQRIFEKRYGQSYAWLIASEHINRPHEILREIRKRFRIVHRSFFPFGVPLVAPNLCIGLTLVPKGHQP